MKKIILLVLSLSLWLSPYSSVRASDRPAEARVSMLAAGDNIVHGAVYADAERAATYLASTGESGDAYYFGEMYENVQAMISAADIAFINQEGPVTSRRPSGYPQFNAPAELADTLSAVGFDVVNLANNHALDMDFDRNAGGLAETAALMREKNLLPIGTYRNSAEREEIPIVEKNGVRVAFLAYTYGTNGISVPAGAEYGVFYAEDATIASQITAAREQADFVVVSVHWGEEGSFEPSEEQRRMATKMSDLGADVILGHHSHVLGPIEWITRPDGGRTLVAYSLGNFLSAMLYPQYMVGGMLTFDLCLSEGGGRVENVLFTPTVCHYGRASSSAKTSAALKTRSGIRVYPLALYSDGMMSHHGALLYSDFSRHTLLSYVTETIAPAFLPDYFMTTH